MTLRAREFDLIISKFGFETRDTDHVHAWLKVDGKLAVRTRRSKGSGELPAFHLIRQQLKLSEGQLAEAIRCDLDLPGYIRILKEKGII